MSDLKIMSISLGRRGAFPIYGFEMTRALAEYAEVSMLVADSADNIDDWRSLDLPAKYVSTYSSNLTGALSFFNVPKFLSIKRFIYKQMPDAVYYPGGHYWKAVIDMLLPPSTRVVMTEHDPIPHPGDIPLASRIIAKLDRRLPDGFILLNRTQLDDFIKTHGIPNNKVTVIPHGVFSGYTRNAVDLSEMADPEITLLRSSQYYLFIGRIVKYKGIATLLRAWNKIAEYSDKILVIAGSGQFSSEERLLIEQTSHKKLVIINRWLTDKDMASLTKNAYMTVLPYEGATQSGVIPAASAFGTPSIASDSGGLPEQIVDGSTGMLFKMGDAAALASVFERADAMSSDAYQMMRNKCKRYADENWSWDVLAGQLAHFIRHITSLKK